jgi:hypothetical protein
MLKIMVAIGIKLLNAPLSFTGSFLGAGRTIAAPQ